MKKINYSGQRSDNRGQEFIPHPSSLILRRFLLSLAAVLCLTAGPAHALDISDYTAYPPFLPRVTSPNILFLLDYSKSMVRPAYGNCKSLSDYSDAGVVDSTTADTDVSNCRTTFNQIGVGEITLTGTVSVTNGSTTVTGTGTQFSTALSAGNTIRIKNVDYTISSIASATSLTLSSTYRGTTESGLTVYKAGTLIGTVSVTINSATVTGTGTSFSTELAAGGTIILKDVPYTISSIASDTSLTLASTYSGTTAAGFTARKGDAYSRITPYDGYFENGYTGSGSYSDASAFKYNCTAASNGTCDKDSSGVWNGNWLNWLTATQFDILKKVAIGGDVNPAPEQAAPNTVRSILTDGYTFRKTVALKEGDTNGNGVLDYCEGKVPDALCKKFPDMTGAAPYTNATYSWKSSASTTHVWNPTGGAYNCDGTGECDDSASSAITLPFPFTFYGNTYTQIYISTNGYIGFTNSNMSAYSNQDMPNATAGYPDTIIAPFWDDLYVRYDADPNKNADIEYFIIDSGANAAPNRIFVVNFDPVYHINDSGKADPLRFQMLLYEGSNHIVFQYNDVRASIAGWGGGKSATIGVENSSGTAAKKYSFCTACASAVLSNSQAIFATPHLSFTVTPRSGTTDFQPAAPFDFAPSGANPAGYKVEIDIDANGSCTSEGVGCYYNQDRATYYDHETVGLLQDFRDGELGGTLGFRLAIEQLNGTTSANMDGGKVVKHFNAKDTTGWASLMTATRSQTPTTNTPLAEAVQIAEGYFKQDTSYNMGLTAANSWTNDGTGSTCASTGTNYDPYCFQSAAQRVSCCKSFVLLVSSGNYSNDNRANIYGDAADSDGQLIANAWRSTDDSGSEGTKANGGWLDNVAYKAHTTDWRSALEGTQNLSLYAVNTFGEGSGDGTNILKKAAKYGGFDDSLGATTGAYDASVSGNCTPAKGEDDKNCDGVPDTYFEASGGSDLKSKIISAVMDIMKSSASGTSVSVLSTSAGGEGAIYQAYFYPARIEGTTDERTWPGFLRAFFLDKYENLRDDSSGGAYNSCPGASCAYSGTPDAKLVMANDKVVQMYLDEATSEVKANTITDADGILPTSPTIDAVVTMDQIASIWEGGKKLALRDKLSTSASTRKIYTWLNTGGTTVSSTAGGFSSIGGTAKDFTTAEASSLKYYLRAQAGDVDGAGPYSAFTADKEAEYVIRFIRGEVITPDTTSSDNTGVSYRNRCITISGATQETGCTGSNQRVWVLGDIVYSTPTLVPGPGEQYDLLYSDGDYKDFKTKYQNRRRMVYVGANDGMLHAFNAGVYTAGDDSGTSAVESGKFVANPTSGNGWTSPTPAIGDELWAFIPHDNLPHLAWLACNGTSADPAVCGSSEYTHVFYVDSRPKVTDVRIFNNSDGSCGSTASGLIDGQDGACHPGGWGTIMIMGMRLGGGAIPVDLNGDGDTADAGEDGFRSAYYAFDVTDPEKKPRLLWRFDGIVDANSNGIVDEGEDKGLGFTTSYPAIAKICTSNDTPCSAGTEKWYMIVGNGSNNMTGTQASGIRDYGGNSTTLQGKVFVVDLADGSPDNTLTLEPAIPPATGKTYMGDPLVVDVNFDFTSDVIYVGSSIQSTGSLTVTGKVYRIQTNGGFAAAWTGSTLFNTTKPVLTPPSVATDSQRNLWVFFGTGRLRNTDDLTNSEQQTFYGIKDACWKDLIPPTSDPPGKCDTTSPGYDYTLSQLVNTSDAAVYSSDTHVTGVTALSGYTGYTGTYSSLQTMMRSTTVKGWYLNLSAPLAPATTPPSERALSRAAALGGVVLFTTYTPVSNVCSIFGAGKLYTLNYETGTAYNLSIVGTTDSSTGIGDSSTSTGGTYISRGITLGDGMPTQVGIAVGETLTGFIQNASGRVERFEWEPGLNVKSGAASWREKSGGGGASEIETIYKHIVK